MKSNLRLKQPLLTLNKPSEYSGIIYSEVQIEKVLKDLPNGTLYGDLRTAVYSPAVIKPEEIAFTLSNFQIEDHILYGDVEILRTPMGMILMDMPVNEIRYSVTSMCQFDGHLVTYMSIVKGTAFSNMIEHGLLNDPSIAEIKIGLI